MGVFDTAKAAMRLRKVQGEMKQKKTAAKSGALAVSVNGLNDMDDIEAFIEELKVEFPGIEESVLRKLADYFIKHIKKAFSDAKGQMQKDMASSMDMEDFKDLLG